MKESDLYESISDALKSKFSRRGVCKIWLTSIKIPDIVLEMLPDDVAYILRDERQFPD